MLNGIKQIFGKEMARILKDKKMVFSVFFLPVIIMVVLLTIINSLAGQMQSDIEDHKSIVWMQNEPESFEAFLSSAGMEYSVRTVDSDSDRAEAEDQILNGKADLLIEFPENFDQLVAGFQEGDPVPQVKTYYNPSEDYSAQAYQEISVGVLESYRQTLLAGRVGNPDAITVFTVNSDNDDMVIQDDEKASGRALGMMLPYFITILLFAGAMGIGTDMIAGEKERGTMASLLVAPVKRSSIVLGKVFALMAVSGISSLNLNLGADQIIMMGLLLIAIAFLYSAVVALISVFAKTTKEASSYIMPVYMVVLVVGLLTMFRMGDGGRWDFYIPFYNSAVALQLILSHELTMS